jgi:DNA invertase Pin-like site-specific DNA recombinase
MSKHVIELIRVSTEGQAAQDRAGIPAQRAANSRTAAQFGLEIISTIEMSDVSGASVLRAPQMQQLLSLIESPKIHGVVTKEFSRLMRPESFCDYVILQQFVDTNTILYLPEGPLDLSNKTGRLMGTIRAAIAGLERTEILERVWLAKEEKRRTGKFAQSAVCLPFGVSYTEAQGWRYTPDAEKVREAFRLFLSGETSYWTVGKKVGIAPVNLRVIMRNPIYTGWRVIDKKRDPSGLGRRTRPDGRQADRPKILRAPEDVIRVKVIMDALIPEADFERVQAIMEMKRTRHWRHNPNYEHQYTYNGFLTCAVCGELIYTYRNRKERRYYVCKAKQYPSQVEHRCDSVYMRREILESTLDELFAIQLTDPGFLRDIAEERESTSHDGVQQANVLRLQQQVESLRDKRQRVLDAYFENVISRDERDHRLAGIDHDLRLAQEMLLRQTPSAAPVDPTELAWLFEPFTDWKFLNRNEKRRILTALGSEIKTANYRIQSISLLSPASALPDHNQATRTDRDSSPPPA